MRLAVHHGNRVTGSDMAAGPWYRRYDEIRSDVVRLRTHFRAECKRLEQNPDAVLAEFGRDLIARIVHESNWQEGIYVERGRTRELSDFVFDQLDRIEGPHLDMEHILEVHRESVVSLKAEGASLEDVAALNLSRAHLILKQIQMEMMTRRSAILVQVMRGWNSHITQTKPNLGAEELESIRDCLQLSAEETRDASPVYGPLTQDIATRGELISSLMDIEFQKLLRLWRIKVDYIHFLHRITMMGISPPRKIGVFRDKPVSVGDPDVLFPTPSLVPNMMEEYCEQFPSMEIIHILPQTDVIMTAAKASYRFVRIHPYSDGNGRLSRLLMNFVLFLTHPPVCLKADRKGRHRYATAIRRANRGQLEPLACLIAMGLKDTYERMLSAISV